MENLIVSYQGKPGAYSEYALQTFFKKYDLNVIAKSAKNFKELFEFIEKETFLGVVPIENSNAGSVVDNYDLFQLYDVEIIGEINLKIEHCLVGIKNSKLEDIKYVYSHPQALMQCSNYINENKLESCPYLDTAGSAEFISLQNKKEFGAISSKIVLKHYDLKLIEENIQNSSKNTTRFFIVKKRGINFEFEKNFTSKNKSTIYFKTKDRSGVLYKCLGSFATNNINLTKIESRPDIEKNFYYVFFIDIEDNLTSKKAKHALEELSFFSSSIKILGTYEKDVN